MSQQTGETISVLCKCGKKLKAPASAVGKRAKCPKCGNVITVHAPPPKQEDDFDALYDLAADSEKAQQQEESSPRCPQCISPMTPGAVLCTNCGYDARTGKSVAARPAVAGTRYDPTIAAAAAQAAAKRAKIGPADKMAPQASFLKGLAASVAGAAIGGVIWFLVAFGTGYELYFLVLLVGALAGLGMQWGQQGYSYLGGFAAAGITFLTMVVARLAVIVALIVPMMKADFLRSQAEKEAMRMPDLSMYDDRVVDALFEEQIKLVPKPKDPPPSASNSNDDEIDSEEETLDASELQEIAAYQAVEKKLKEMPKAEYDAMVRKLEREERDASLQWLITEDILMNDMQYHPSRAGQVLTEKASQLATEKIAGMSEAQRDAEYKRLNAAAEKKRQEAMAKAKAEAAARRARGEAEPDSGIGTGAAVAIGGIVIFFLIFGGIKGAIFTLLALGLAYRTASGAVSDT